MQIAHVALWTKDLDQAAQFWERYFQAQVGPAYHSKRRAGFVSRFASLPGNGGQIELMTLPGVEQGSPAEQVGWTHVAISLGNAANVDSLAAACAKDGLLQSPPRMTGDGFYEAVITMPDGTPIEITA